MNTTRESTQPTRDLRQREIVPPERLAECHALVIGVGAIGRQVALQLAAIGMPRMTLFDDDEVQIENLAPQGYWAEDLSASKVHSTTSVCGRINPEIEVIPIPVRFKRSTARSLATQHRLIAFVCVDSIQTRRLIWESLRGVVALLVDGRMSAEVIRVLAVDQPATDDYYATTLFAAEQAYTGSCTAKSTIYTASIAAGLMLGQFTRWLRQMPVDSDVSLNLLSMELSAGAATPMLACAEDANPYQ